MACIEATRFPQNPKSPEAEVLADADLYHFAKPDYPKYEQRLRDECKTFFDRTYTDAEWNETNCALLKSHSYYTTYGKTVLKRFKEVDFKRLGECMSGFEHQVAAHMMEGMIDESLVLTRVIHDRCHGSKRNPFNEIECSDHYACAMASYGTFITACGFEYHGSKGYIRFSPKLGKENFKAAFTAAEGWGSYEQAIAGENQTHTLSIKYGYLSLKQLSFDHTGTKFVFVTLNGRTVPAGFANKEDKVSIDLEKSVIINKDQSLVIDLT